MTATSADDRMRIDKWLWAARFYKTRTLSADAVEGGKVHVNDQRVKPAKEVKSGDMLEIAIGDMHWTVVVRALAEQRRPAPDARLLYQETEESQAAREAQLELREPGGNSGMHRRPTKRDRRRIERLRRSG